MKYTEIRPNSPLNSYILCIWQLTGSPEEAKAYGKQLLIPNEASEIVFNFADSFPDTLKRSVSDPFSAYVVGPITKTGSTHFEGAIDLLGLTFKPGMATPFLPLNLQELRDSILPLNQVWKGLNQRYEELYEAQTLVNRWSILESELCRQLDSGAKTKALCLQVPIHQSHTVRTLAQQEGVSERTLERRFLRQVGLNPKEYLRIKRINRVAKHRLVEHKDLYDIITDEAYVDYSHLIKDLNAFELKSFASEPSVLTDFVTAYLAV